MLSLIWNQFQSPAYEDMLRYAWRNTDPGYSSEELTMGASKPKLTSAMQFGFEAGSKCQRNGCPNYAFVRCSYCDRLVCVDHFLNRTCFHDTPDEWDLLDLTERPDDERLMKSYNAPFDDIPQPPNATDADVSGESSTASGNGARNATHWESSTDMVVPFRLSESHFEYNPPDKS